MLVDVDIDLYEFDDDEIVEHVLSHPDILQSVLEEADSEVSFDTIPKILTHLKRDNIIEYERMLETLRYKELI